MFTIRPRHRKEPCLAHFSSFVNEETTRGNDPMFSRGAVQGYVQNPERMIIGREKWGVLPYHFGSAVSHSENRQSKCDSSHDLENCNLFNEKPFPEKSKFLLDKKLCHGCLFPTLQNHDA